MNTVLLSKACPTRFPYSLLSSPLTPTPIYSPSSSLSLSLSSPFPHSLPSSHLSHGADSLSQLAYSSHGRSLVSPNPSLLKPHLSTFPHHPKNSTTNYLFRFCFSFLAQPHSTTTSSGRRNLGSAGNKNPILSPNLNLILLLNDVYTFPL